MPGVYWVDMKDLIVLVADKNMEFLLGGLLPRVPAIEQIKQFNFEIFVHPYRDPGIYNDAEDFLASFHTSHRFTLVLLDHQGSGHENLKREEIEEHISKKLDNKGWHKRNGVLCISPELENWIWVNELHMKNAISWGKGSSIRDWLQSQHLLLSGQSKPENPKLAFEAVLRHSGTPRSSSIYKEISSSASYRNCKDPAFLKMIQHLKNWFS